MAAPTIDTLRSQVKGKVVSPDDAGYDEARAVYNGMIDRRPAMVVQCTSTEDVVATVRHAREAGGDLSVRGGSHSVPGFGTNDGGVVIDLSGMRTTRVDAEKQVAHADGGCTWGDFNDATHEHKLATTGGIISTTGVGGLTLGGGIGYLSRKYGLSLDNLVSAEVVTADGETVTASADEHGDLFWALRGGGGNFGVVTRFDLTVHPLDEIVAAAFFFPIDRVRDVLEFYRVFVDKAPEELGMFPAFQIAPPLPFIPEAEVGKPFIAMVSCWAGPTDQAEQQLAPIRDVAPIVAEMVAPMPYPAINALFDDLVPRGLQHYWKTAFASELTDGAIDAHIEFGPKVPVVNSTMHIYPINGACHRVAPESTAFAGRDANFATEIGRASCRERV